MARMRHVYGAVLLPLGLLASHDAAAAGPAPDPTDESPRAAAQLPDGVHRTLTGRYSRDVCDHKKRFHCLSHVLLPSDWTPDRPLPPLSQGIHRDGNPPAGGMRPGDILATYDIPADTAASGRIVAILDSPDSHAYTDLTAYRAGFGLPALPECAGLPTGTLPACFAHVSETGGTSSGLDSPSGDMESSLDMDMISAACPDCSILFVDMGTWDGIVTDADFTTAAATAVSLGAVATSISWGGGEDENGPDGGPGPDPSGSNYTVPGHLVLASSGDGGYSSDGASYPSSALDVLAVGGTTVYRSTFKYDEAVWYAGGGGTTSGCSIEFAMPPWQATGLAGSGCSRRATADVAAAAAFVSDGRETDISIYDDGWTDGVEGTSAASPMVAAILTRLGVAGAIADSIAGGESNWIYDNAVAFNDLGSPSYPVDPRGSSTNARNPASCKQICTARTGWDGPSGIGTPDGVKIVKAWNSGTDAGVDSGSSGSSSSSASSSSSSSSTTSSSSVGSSSTTASSSTSASSSTGGTSASTGSASSGSSTGGSSTSSGSATSSSSAAAPRAAPRAAEGARQRRRQRRRPRRRPVPGPRRRRGQQHEHRSHGQEGRRRQHRERHGQAFDRVGRCRAGRRRGERARVVRRLLVHRVARGAVRAGAASQHCRSASSRWRRAGDARARADLRLDHEVGASRRNIPPGAVATSRIFGPRG